MNPLAKRFQQVLIRIRDAERKAARAEGSVKLLAVSKTKSAVDVAELYALGQRNFGENYLQEALQKQAELAAYAIEWHFIGPIQSNKTRLLASRFAWVHSVDRVKIARRLSEQRPDHMPPLNICLQVNISGESSKSGVAVEGLPELVDGVLTLPGLMLRGVMAIPAPGLTEAEQLSGYQQLVQAARASLGQGFDTFSAGMSNDLEAAVASGSTMVRIGSALFGDRS